MVNPLFHTEGENLHRLHPLDEVGEVRGLGATGLIRHTWQVVGISLLPLLIWTGVAQIKEVAHVTGQVLPSGAMQAVQHMEGGIVSEVLVRESQLVEKNQALLRFDSRQTMPEQALIEVRLAGLEARAARLRAFAASDEPDFSPIDGRFAELVDIQRRIHQDQVQTLAQNRAMADALIAQRNSELAQTTGDLANAKEQMQVTGDMVKIRKELLEHKAISRIIHLETLRAHITAQGEVERLEKQVTNIRESLAEAESRQHKLTADMQQEAMDELNAVTNEIAQVRETGTRMEDRVERLDLRASVRGMVQDLKVRTPGAVVAPGKILLHIVPVEDNLKVEAQISPEQVGRIAIGQRVVVKLTSYEYARFGAAVGTLVTISPSTLTDEANKPYYRGIITLEKNYLGSVSNAQPILPGMLAQVDIALGEQSVMESLWRPIHRTIHDAFKER